MFFLSGMNHNCNKNQFTAITVDSCTCGNEDCHILFKKQSVHWLGLLSFKCQIFGWMNGKVVFISSLKQDAQLHLQAGQKMTNAPIEHKRAEEFHFF